MSPSVPRPAGRRLGEGYEPHVDDVDGQLMYSIPVDSWMMTRSFEFEIEPADLAVLLADPYRRAALYIVLHAILQRSMTRGQAEVRPADFRAIASQILFAATDDLRAFLAAAGVEYHLDPDVLIARELRRVAGDADS